MGLSAALGAARSGLTVTATQADLLSRNISNAQTKGYTRKSAELITTPTGGVKVSAVERHVSDRLDRLDRGNASRLSAEQTIAEGMRDYTNYLGQPNDMTSPTARLGALNDAMITLSTAVGDRSAQLSVVTAAREMAGNLRSLSGTLSTIGSEVEMNLRYDVADLNTTLDRIAKLNKLITAEPDGTVAMAQYQDDMGNLLQTASEFMDIQTVKDRNGMVSVLTSGGTELVTGATVRDLTYDPVAGTLTAGGIDITPGGGSRAFNGGSLAGLFTLRNETLPEWSAQLDTMAAALVEGFSREAPLGSGLAGLFTDGADAYDPAAIAGLARRIAVNPEVDPEAGGNPALLQAGTDPARPAGDGAVIDAMVRLFSQETQITGRDFGTGSSLVKMTAAIVGAQQSARSDAERTVAATRTAAATISSTRENLQGVSIDDELQNLLAVERNYAANAKVLTAVDEMLATLLQAV